MPLRGKSTFTSTDDIQRVMHPRYTRPIQSYRRCDNKLSPYQAARMAVPLNLPVERINSRRIGLFLIWTKERERAEEVDTSRFRNVFKYVLGKLTVITGDQIVIVNNLLYHKPVNLNKEAHSRFNLERLELRSRKAKTEVLYCTIVKVTDADIGLW